MKKQRLLVRAIKVNVNRRFQKAIYKEQEVNKIFASYREASKMYNLKNCNYDYIDDNSNVIKSVKNYNYNELDLNCMY